MSAPGSTTAEPAQAQLEGEELDQALRNQIAYYFSPKNLANDNYLRGQMDAKGFVAVSTIAAFKRVSVLAKDIDHITRAIRECPSLVLNETGLMVRGAQKPQRTTLVVKKIPEGTSEEDVKGLFSFPDCPVPAAVKHEFGEVWFVTFRSQDDVQKAHRGLTEHNVKLNGKDIGCHIKAERSFVPQTFSRPVYHSWAPNANANSFNPRNSYNSYNNYNSRTGNGQGHYGEQHKRRNGRIGGQGGKRNEKSRTPRKGKRTESKTKELPSSADFPALSSSKSQAVKYDREAMTKIVEALAGKPNPRPSSYPAATAHGIAREEPLSSSQLQLKDAFPFIFPASPSPVLAAQTHSSAELIPFLDLDFMPSTQDPKGVDQHTVAAAVARQQGIEVPPEPVQPKRRSRANSTAKAAPKKPAAAAPPAEDEFKTVTRKQRGGHGRNQGGHRQGGHGAQRGRGRDGERRRDNAGSRNNNSRQGQGRPPRSEAPAAAPAGPRKPTLADILKQGEEKAKQAPARKPAPKAAPAAPKRREATKEKQAEAKKATAEPPTTGKPSFAEMLKRKAEAKASAEAAQAAKAGTQSA